MEPITIRSELTFEIDEETLTTLIEMAGYGIDSWARWAVVDDEKHTYTIHFWEDPDVQGPIKTVRLTYRQVAEALVKLACNPETFNVGRQSYLGEYLGKWIIGRDAGDIDADFADAVIQVAVFDTVQYS